MTTAQIQTERRARQTLAVALTVALRNTNEPVNEYVLLDELARHYDAATRDWYMSATDRQITLLVNAAKREANRRWLP